MVIPSEVKYSDSLAMASWLTWDQIIAQREAAGLPTDVVPEKVINFPKACIWHGFRRADGSYRTSRKCKRRMSSAGQRPRKRYFVDEILKQLDVSYVVSIVPPPSQAPFLLASFWTTYRCTVSSLFSAKL
jgi:hypothetical protein